MPQALTAKQKLPQKARIYCVLIIALFFCGYLDWGGHQGKFLFHIPAELLQSGTREGWMHPLVLGTIAGILLLLIAAVWPRVPWMLVLLGLVTPVIVSGLILIGGIMGRRPVMIVSILPFFIALGLLLRALRYRPA